MRDFGVVRLPRPYFSSALGAEVALVVLAIGAAGCLQKESPGAEVENAPPGALNSNPQITNFGVYAHNSATLRDRTVLAGGDIGVRMKGSGPFLVTGYELALVAGVQVDVARNTIANRVLLQGAKVGDVQTNTLTVQNGGTYTKKYAFPTTMPALPTLAPVFPGTAALTVNASSTVVVSPGAYGAVSIGTKGVLRLTGGVYHMASLQLDDDARIEAMAAVQVRVAGRVTGRLSTLARVWIGAAAGVTLTAADLRIEVSGKNGTGGGLTETPKAAVFGNDATILGVILVPNGTLQMGQRNTVTGALVGKDVYVDMDSRVTFQSGLAVLKCAQFCNDGNPCTKDTCTGEVCSYPAAASGTSCSDGNTCNGAETCDNAGKCKAGTPVSCTALDQCHTAGVCDPGTGVCSNPAKADGTTCNDANACTVSDICRAGICSGTTYSCDDGLACTTDTCNGTGGCTHTVTAGNCAINGVCYAAGATNPANTCQQCTPATSQTAWSLKSSGTVCRAAAGPCDVAEVCNGTSPACPPDTLVPAATVCRASAGLCDLAETCTGASAACPPDALVPAATVCRASAGLCDLAERCTGASAACPADALVPAATVCRASAGPCDLAETCTGASAACPADALAPATTVCRASTGPCDLAERCTGASAACPADAFAPATTVCRASAGPCDLAENCTGASAACPADALAPATTVCRAAAGPCDLAENCTGAGAACPADGFLQASLECRASAGPCDVAEICSGTSATCPADAFLPASTVCRPAVGACDVAENCGGASATCPADAKAANDTPCDDGNPCTKQDKCQDGACIGTGEPVSAAATGVSIDVIASLDSSTGTSVDGVQTFAAPTQFSLPSVIPTIEGLSGTGTAILTFHSSTACIDVSCTYQGASSVPGAVTPEDKVLGQIYALQSCSDNSQPNAVLAVTSIGLHVTSGDTGTPFVQIQIVKSYPGDQGITVFPPPADPGPLIPASQLGDGSDLPPSPETAAHDSWHPLNLPSPDPSLSNPEVDGAYTPQADPYLSPLDLSH